MAPSTIARRLGPTREEILAHTRQKLLADLGIDTNEMDSILGLVRSRIEITQSAFERP